MSRDVFMSLLALDAYNREYDQSLFVNGNAVGGARVLDRNELDVGALKFAEWQAAGFYAIAYELQDEVVVSYRGTSFNNGFDETTLLDATNGWITRAGADRLAGERKRRSAALKRQKRPAAALRASCVRFVVGF